MNNFEKCKFEEKLLGLIASIRVEAMETFFSHDQSCQQAEQEYNAAIDAVKQLNLNQEQFFNRCSSLFIIKPL